MYEKKILKFVPLREYIWEYMDEVKPCIYCGSDSKEQKVLMAFKEKLPENWNNSPGVEYLYYVEQKGHVYKMPFPYSTYERMTITFNREYIEGIIAWMKKLKSNSPQILTYNWFIGKLIDIKINKISETNLRVYSMIARNMLNGIKYEEKKMVLDLILERGADLIDMKQCEWQELCISQESQLPF